MAGTMFECAYTGHLGDRMLPLSFFGVNRTKQGGVKSEEMEIEMDRQAPEEEEPFRIGGTCNGKYMCLRCVHMANLTLRGKTKYFPLRLAGRWKCISEWDKEYGEMIRVAIESGDVGNTEEWTPYVKKAVELGRRERWTKEEWDEWEGMVKDRLEERKGRRLSERDTFRMISTKTHTKKRKGGGSGGGEIEKKEKIKKIKVCA